MFFAIQAFNNIIAYRLLITCHKVPSNSYHHQSINNFEKLLDKEGAKNNLIIIISILLVFYMYVGPTRFWENGALNTEFDTDRRLYLKSTGLDWDDGAKIEEAITANKNNKDKEKDF